MQVGLMAPQGWKGDYDGWEPGRCLGADGRAGAAGRGARLRVALGVRPLPHGPGADATRSRSSRSRCSPRWPWPRRASASGTWSSAPAFATRRSRRSCHRRSTSSAAVASSSGIGAGWKEEEWRAYGYGFPTLGDRMGALGDHLEIISAMLQPGPLDLRGPIRPRPRRDQRAEGHPAAADPDHRRRQWPAADGGLRHPLRRRAQLRLHRGRRHRRAHARRARRCEAEGRDPATHPVLAVYARRADA